MTNDVCWSTGHIVKWKWLRNYDAGALLEQLLAKIRTCLSKNDKFCSIGLCHAKYFFKRTVSQRHSRHDRHLGVRDSRKCFVSGNHACINNLAPHNVWVEVRRHKLDATVRAYGLHNFANNTNVCDLDGFFLPLVVSNC